MRNSLEPIVPSQSLPLDSEQGLIDEILGLKTSAECQVSWWSASISHLIRRLFRVSKLIAKSTTTDRHAKAEASGGESFDSTYDIAHLEHKFERLKNKPWLLSRLGEANTKRRKYFRYCRIHRDKLSEQHGLHSRKVAMKADDSNVAKSAFRSTSDIPAMTAYSKPSNMHTIASTLGPVDVKLPDDGFDDAASFSTMANSVTNDRESHALSAPSFTDIAEPGVDFECPYCFVIQNFNGQLGWKYVKHKSFR